MKKRKWWMLILVTSLLAGLGCGQELEPFGPGSMDLTWKVAPLGCDAGEVESVEIRLENDRNVHVEQVDCQARGVRIEEIAPGRYDLTIEGASASGTPTFDARLDSVFIRPDSPVFVGPVELEAIPAEVQIYWRPDDWEICEVEGLEEVEVAVFDGAYHRVHLSMWNCRAGIANVAGLPAGQYYFRVRTENQESKFEGVRALDVGWGQQAELDIDLIQVDAGARR